MAPKKRVAVIGCGFSGLGAVKECLEHGFWPTCYEQKDDIGGLWYAQNPKPDNIQVAARVYSNLFQNGSKPFYTYSDFPALKEHPYYLSAKYAKQYAEAYAREFKLMRHINLNHYVTKVEKTNDYEKTGRWTVTALNNLTNEEVVETFDAVLCCTGHYSKRRPYGGLPGQNLFSGTICHVGDYWNGAPYVDRTVLLIGGSISSVHIASQLAAAGATKVYIISKDGIWVSPQAMNGKSWEVSLFNRRWRAGTSFPKVQAHFVNALQLRYDHGQLGLLPQKPLFQSRMAFSDDIDKWIHGGLLKLILGEVKEFVADGVILSDGKHLLVDDVIFCTGYEVNYPYIRREDLSTSPIMQDDWWMYMYPIHQQHPTLWLIVSFFLFSALPPVAELQCRFACGVLENSLKLPTKAAMKQRIEQEKAAAIQQYGFWPGMHVEMMGYVYELAKMIGCWPSPIQVGMRSPKLAWTIFNGPLLPQQFRLLGPHAKWEIAEKALLEAEKNAYGPVREDIWVLPTVLPAKL